MGFPLRAIHGFNLFNETEQTDNCSIKMRLLDELLYLQNFEL